MSTRDLARVALVLCAGAVAGLVIETSAIGLALLRCTQGAAVPTREACAEVREVVQETERGAGAVMLAAFGFLGWKVGRGGDDAD